MNQLTRPSAPGIAAVRAQVAKLTPEFARALPPGMNPERFARVVLTAIQQSPPLLECTQDSLWGACMKAAQDGLLPDGREGAIVKRWNGRKRCAEAHWMPMVAGLIAKAKRKGSVAGLVANVVYEGEHFEVLLGDEERITHRRDVELVARGREIAVYAVATMKDGTKEREVMSWEQVQQVQAASQDGGASGPWKTWPEEMARKSCLRRLSKRLPSLDEGDDDLRQAVERVDELYDFGKPSAAAPVLVPSAEGVPALSHEADAGEAGVLEQDVSAGPEAVPSGSLREVAEQVQRPAKAPDPDAEWASAYVARLKAATTAAELRAAMDAPDVYDMLDHLVENRPRLAARVKEVEDERTIAVADAAVAGSGATAAPVTEPAEAAP